MSMNNPFALLSEFDQRCRLNAKGLPSGTKVADDWIGIGFKITGKKLVAKMNDVAEILPPPETIRVPGVQGWVKGLANVRGTLMPILDMNFFLNGKLIKSGSERRILVVNKQNVVAGLLVEEVFGLRRFKPEMRGDGSSANAGLLEPYIDGTFIDEQDQWEIISIDKLVSHEQFLKVV